KNYWKYDWVLPVYRYEGLEPLLVTLANKVIAGTAGRLHDRLAQKFGCNNLFMDVDHIPAGVDFTEYLHSQVTACDVFLAVIGPNWLDAKDDSRRRRFDNPDDFVTIEIAAALAR